MYDERFFDQMASLYLKQSAWSKLRLGQIENMVDPQPGDEIIHLGCGMGSVSHFCAMRGAHVAAVDLSATALETARRLFADANNITYYQRDVADLHGIASESFDKAVTADLVEHIPQPVFESMLRETLRILKPGGCFFIYTPNPRHLIERLKAHNFILKQNPTHIDISKLRNASSPRFAPQVL